MLNRKGFIFIIIIQIFIILFILYIIKDFSYNRILSLSEMKLFLFLILNILLFPFTFTLLKNKKDILASIYLVNVLYIMYFVISPYVFFSQQKLFFNYDIRPYFIKGNIYFIIGIISMYIGYLSCRLKIKKIKLRKFKNIKVKKMNFIYYISFILFIFGVIQKKVSIVNLITLGLFGKNITYDFSNSTTSNFLLFFGNSLVTIFTMLLLDKSLNKKKIFIYIIYIRFLSILGFRGPLIISILIPVIANLIYKKKRPNIINLLKYLILIFVFMCGIGIARDSLRNGKGFKNIVKDRTLSEVLESSGLTDEIFATFYGLVENVPKNNDNLHGITYKYIFIGIIPRSIWENKPSDLAQRMTYIAYNDDKMVRSGASYPNIGEMYANFGLKGIIINMFILGFFLKKLNYILVKKTIKNNEIIFYSIIYCSLINYISRGYMVTQIPVIIYYLLPLLFEIKNKNINYIKLSM